MTFGCSALELTKKEKGHQTILATCLCHGSLNVEANV